MVPGRTTTAQALGTRPVRIVRKHLRVRRSLSSWLRPLIPGWRIFLSSTRLEAAPRPESGLEGVVLPAGAAQPTRLDLPANLSRDEWRATGAGLTRLGSTYQWRVG